MLGKQKWSREGEKRKHYVRTTRMRMKEPCRESKGNVNIFCWESTNKRWKIIAEKAGFIVENERIHAGKAEGDRNNCLAGKARSVSESMLEKQRVIG